jgi:cysteinyl-tRNA synthetase
VRLHSERALKRSGLTVDYVTKEIERRSAARKRKDYALADQIRENLKKRGIRLMDNADRTEWEIVI